MFIVYDATTMKCTGSVLYEDIGITSLEVPDTFDIPVDLHLHKVNNGVLEFIGIEYSVEEAISRFTQKTTSFIQSKVDEYNKLNGTVFESVHNCESYSRIPTYTHQVFCEKVWLWSVGVWEAVRAYQETSVSIPTDAEFQAVLDSVLITW